MKAYEFNGAKYMDLNSLGQAFSAEYFAALDSIKDKSFLKFVKSIPKKKRKKILKILYENRYLENALTLLIYEFTDKELLVIGGRIYASNFQDLANDIYTNGYITYFLEEKGISKTFFNTIDSERLKNDILILEANYDDPLVQSFAYNYIRYDGLEEVTSYFYEALNADDSYSAVFNKLNEEEAFLRIASCYGLERAVDLKNSNCQVLKLFKLIESACDMDLIKKTIENAFFVKFLAHFQNYKYKKGTKKLFKQFKSFKSKSKKLGYIDANIKLLNLYLEFVKSYRLGHIKAKSEEAELNIEYCQTLVPNDIGLNCENQEHNETQLKPLEEKPYDLRKLHKVIRNHRFFAKWLLIWTLLVAVYYGLAFLVKQYGIPFIEDNGASIMDGALGLSKLLISPFNYIMIGGLGLSFIFGVFILAINYAANRKYFKLCKLVYYRKNHSILTDKEFKDEEKIAKVELKYAKKIDRFYRFYGAIGVAGLSLALTLLTNSLLVVLGDYIYKDISLNATDIFLDKYNYLLFIPTAVVFISGLLRHKKTSWSVFLTIILSLVLTFGLVLAFPYVKPYLG